jgi:predicted TPR repeat methyltransferase
MLENARVRGVYDELVKSELTAFIAARSGEFDLIVSADTLCYFGELDAVFGAAREALREGGALVFTVEAAEDAVSGGYTIRPHGRYSHSRRYLAQTLRSAGLEVQTIVPEVLREESREPVAGLVVTARRPRPGGAA